jgi:hypothetical protein
MGNLISGTCVFLALERHMIYTIYIYIETAFSYKKLSKKNKYAILRNMTWTGESKNVVFSSAIKHLF